MYVIGYDVGSSSVKASLVDVESGQRVAAATAPTDEMPITAPRAGWAEQDPAMWWRYVVEATRQLAAKADLARVRAVGVSYQMHGLVAVDRNGRPLRPSIIWCDSRAVSYGEAALRELGEEAVIPRLLNSPGNFTAAKLAWVKEHEPALYAKIWKIMLPGDYVAYRMTGEALTTVSGLSEGIFWDYPAAKPARFLLDYFGFDPQLLCEARDSFGEAGVLGPAAAEELGLPRGVPVAYRAGDQPNNAFSLNVLEPGELAATAGTSGVVYGIVDTPAYDAHSRVNTFVHVNHRAERPRYGVLLCLNGTGILNKWVKQVMMDPPEGPPIGYNRLNDLATQAPVGSDGLVVLPFGNGAERILRNVDYGAGVHGLNFNIHTRAHVARAAQEGIVFALCYGLEIMRDMGIKVNTVRAGEANMFLSPLFRGAFATVSGATVELYNTDGAEGAARGAGWGAGLFDSPRAAFASLALRQRVEPDNNQSAAYAEAYAQWKARLEAVVASA